MLTRKRWTPPNIPPSLAPEVQQYLRDQNKSISDYLLSLEGPGGTVLDELKEWTPTDASGASLSFTGHGGFYLVVGRIVIAWGRLTYPATASGANMTVGGLPLTVKNSNTVLGGGILSFCTETTAAQLYTINNTTTLAVVTNAGGAITNATLSGDTFNFCVIYPY